MAVLKCKMCGGNLNLVEGASTAECEYCGSLQTVPKADDEKKLNLFTRAHRLRADNEFDKAAGVYEAIVADFPEEAEAYWGLVLCKYGIEYVDDPPTGKKVPTCHRTLPTSVIDDPDYRETLKKADVVSKPVYQEEAEKIDQLQKKILDIVSKEKPYDVFICYKETDDDTLRRTEDSSNAQDLFTELTKDGYRVFFARNTLKTIAGAEFEPYIYAALNSAKAMLVIGSCADYYQAVWVKNEWARFLDMMKNDPAKALIPCYKNMDPYDLPREFRNLQALNMADLTFYPALIENLERVISKKEAEKTVVQDQGDSKLASLLDRGNMALEDSDWDSADSFFEEVLNNDSKNAQAYLGKTLAVENCRTLDALLRKLKDACQQAENAQLSLQEDKTHIEAMVQECAIQNYVDEDKLRKLYAFDLSYSSTAGSCNQRCKETEDWWKNHKWLSRAEKFATGETADVLQQARDNLFSALHERIAKAEQAEQEAYDKKLAQYQAHLQQADEEARAMFASASAARQKDYETACSEVEQSTALATLQWATEILRRLKGYEDSDAKYAECLKKIEQIKVTQQAEEAAEKERQWIAFKKERKTQKRNAILRGVRKVLCTCAIIAVIACVGYYFLLAKPKANYNTAMKHYEAGEYQEAIALFSELKNFKDSKEKVCEVKYAYADKLLADGDVDDAYQIFSELAGYSEVLNSYNSTAYQDAKERRLEIVKNNPRFAHAGDIVSYGQYEQDNNLGNGQEAIEWFVYARNGDELLLISKNALDCRRYHLAERLTTDWEKSEIRRWLNDDFYNAAFTENQKSVITTAEIKTTDVEKEYTTHDKVFLLSNDDCSDEKASQFIFEGYEITDYAKSRVPDGSPAETGIPYEAQYTYDAFWLRNPYHKAGALVLYDVPPSSDLETKSRSNYDFAFVRPCVFLNLAES